MFFLLYNDIVMFEFLTVELLAQIIGGIAILINLLSLQFNKHYLILLIRTLGTTLFVIQYFMLGAYIGVIMDVIGIIRNLLFTELVRRKKSTKPYIVIFTIIIILAGVLTIIFTWNDSVNEIMKGWGVGFILATILCVVTSVLSVIAKTTSTISFGINSPHVIRVLNIPAASCWFVYNFLFRSFTGAVNEIFSISSSIIGEIRFRKKPDKTTSK